MPVIPEHSEMDDFVNWDNADPATGMAGLDLMPPQATMTNDDPNHDLDLALANVDGDDFSFWALEHFEANNVALDNMLAVPDPLSANGLQVETPGAPCAHCQIGGFSCKTIQEGQYQGYCTSCVALGCECSFALSKSPVGGAAFPSNPWPILGDHPNSITHQEDVNPSQLHSNSAPDLQGIAAMSSEQNVSPTAPSMPKIGARFSRESVRILKNWLSTHNRHPYPTEEEKETLQRLTGLNKTQITNWLANARRRGKIQPTRSTSPHVGNWSGTGAIDIPKRRGTPALDNKNPLERWVDSPPENEPASVTAIARAVTASASTLSGSPHSLNYTDDGSGRSLANVSSASSVNTTSNSSGSAYSHHSRGSLGSFGSFGRGRRRRRRRTAPKNPDEKTALLAPPKTFMCTFCTETFRTKHDWQRHEKSLHLSLERWVCAPKGPRAVNPETNEASCVFCGEASPDDAHLEGHNYSACQERMLEERTFYRKDHLRQHLKLVHNVKFMNWSMEPWKVATPEIRSRCGFCGIIMDTWTIRVDHLAEHFKTGNTMADWKGDWGFEAPVLEMVENSIPPYLIHDERNSPLPYQASQRYSESPRNAYELIKIELINFILNRRETAGADPTDEEILYETCRIVYASEVLSQSPQSSSPTWLRDLLISSDQLALKAKLAPIRSGVENMLGSLRINGKDSIFEACPLEQQLLEFVKARSLLGLTAMDAELQNEACKIVGRMEESSGTPSEIVANFLLRLIHASTKWLASFRQRAHLPISEDAVDENLRSMDPKSFYSTIHNYSRLETELAEFVRNQLAMGNEPRDADLRKQARIILYEFDDGSHQTAADNEDWLNAFKSRHLDPIAGSCVSSIPSDSLLALESTMANANGGGMKTTFLSTLPNNCFENSMYTGLGRAHGNTVRTGPFFLNDANCYRRLARELSRWVASTLSPNNPNRHVPSDEELQHQARWILYDDDDPWNQTAADNAEWLRRFKRDAGLITEDNGPGLPLGRQWNLAQGGSGFAPPYVYPSGQMTPFEGDKVSVTLNLDDRPQEFETEASTANKYLQSIVKRYPAPALVFCSRELENGLVDFATRKAATSGGSLPTDEALRVKAREILKLNVTAADDPVLLEKFKTMLLVRLGLGQPAAAAAAAGATGLAMEGIVEAPTSTTASTSASEVSPGALNLDVNVSESEMNDILKDMSYDFVQGGDLMVDGGGNMLI